MAITKKAAATPVKPTLTAGQRAKLAEKAKAQWSDPASKLRNRQSQGQNDRRIRPPKKAVEIIEHAVAAYGATKEQLADALGVSVWLFDQWLIRHTEIRDAFERAKGIEHSKLIGVLFAQAMGGNTTAAIVLLKFRHGMRDQGPVPGSDDSPEVKAAKIKQALDEMRRADCDDDVQGASS